MDGNWNCEGREKRREDWGLPQRREDASVGKEVSERTLNPKPQIINYKPDKVWVIGISGYSVPECINSKLIT